MLVKIKLIYQFQINLIAFTLAFIIRSKWSALIPFIVMTTFSTFLIGMVIELRIRIQPSNSIKDEKRLRKEIQFTVTTVLISLSYVSLDLPFFIIQILILDNNLSLNFHIFSFGFTFYVLLLSY